MVHLPCHTPARILITMSSNLPFLPHALAYARQRLGSSAAPASTVFPVCCSELTVLVTCHCAAPAWLSPAESALPSCPFARHNVAQSLQAGSRICCMPCQAAAFHRASPSATDAITVAAERATLRTPKYLVLPEPARAPERDKQRLLLPPADHVIAMKAGAVAAHASLIKTSHP